MRYPHSPKRLQGGPRHRPSLPSSGAHYQSLVVAKYDLRYSSVVAAAAAVAAVAAAAVVAVAAVAVAQTVTVTAAL